MTDTIELLETIGRDASLRHASSEHLVQALTALQASEGLKQAACSGDDSRLMQELGGALTDPPPVHSPTNGGCDEDESDGTDEDRPDRGDDKDGSEAKLES